MYNLQKQQKVKHMHDPIPGSEIRHITFQEMLMDEETPEVIDDIDLQEQWEELTAEEEKETLSAIEDYMNSNCKDCGYVKGSQVCENCFVGGY